MGDPDDIVPDAFGPGLPLIRDWTQRHYNFAGYITGFDPGQLEDRSRLGYSDDEVTGRVEKRLADLFEHEVAVFLVPTGTAANALALAQLTPPWGAVLCHAQSHIATDECGATEFYGGGVKLVTLPGDGGNLIAVFMVIRKRPGGEQSRDKSDDRDMRLHGRFLKKEMSKPAKYKVRWVGSP